MAVIKDTGKVWIKGSVGTIHAVRIDLHNSNKGERTARFIPLDIKPTLSGTLFNGFVKTKHADVLIVASDGNQTKEISVSGEQYRVGGFNSLDSQSFWMTIWRNKS